MCLKKSAWKDIIFNLFISKVIKFHNRQSYYISKFHKEEIWNYNYYNMLQYKVFFFPDLRCPETWSNTLCCTSIFLFCAERDVVKV